MRTWLEEGGAGGNIHPRALDPNTYRYFNPDALYSKHANSYTFIYNPATDKLDAAAYPMFHGRMMHGTQSANPYEERDKAIADGLILGRFGTLGAMGDDPGVKVIGFWGTPPDDVIVKALKAIARDYPEFIDHPDRIMVAGKKPFKSDLLSKYVPNIKEFAGAGGKHQVAKKEANECDTLGINVEGRFLSLDKVIGNLHMVKGVNLELMKSVFCAEYETLRQKAQSMGCEASLSLIEDIHGRINCGPVDNVSRWNSLKKAGASALRADYQRIFSNPERIDTEFRGRQKDIDAAWDFLQKGRRNETFVGFKQWLMNEGDKNEKQRRRRRRSDKTRYLFNRF